MPIGILNIVVRIALVLLTAFLFVLVLLAYLRLKNRKMSLISVGFGIFFAHALVSIPELFNSAYDILFEDSIHLLINLIALVFILLGTLKD